MGVGGRADRLQVDGRAGGNLFLGLGLELDEHGEVPLASHVRDEGDQPDLGAVALEEERAADQPEQEEDREEQGRGDDRRDDGVLEEGFERHAGPNERVGREPTRKTPRESVSGRSTPIRSIPGRLPA